MGVVGLCPHLRLATEWAVCDNQKISMLSMPFLALSSGHGVIFKKGLSIPEANKLECMYY